MMVCLQKKLLYVWVEGDDDERFFRRVIVPRIEKNYDVKFIKYARMKKEKMRDYIKTINSIRADYIFFTDINNSPCITDKKENIQRKFKFIDINKIVVVIKEIESWYLAGLDNDACNQLKIKCIENTDSITKERFNNLIPRKFTSRIDFMLEVLKLFSIDEATRKNTSFKYFIEKYD